VSADAGVLGRIVPVGRAEVAALGWSFAYFFCLLAAYYVVRPVRDEMAVQFGAERLQWLFTATFLTMVALIPVFGGLAARLPVKRLLPAIYGFFALNLVGFYAALESGTPLATLAPAFFVWVSVFNLFVVSVFWSFMADLYSTEQARRLFGVISAGGSLGAVTGPGLTAWLAPAIGIPNLLLVSATLLAAAIGCIAALLHLAPGGGARFLRTSQEETGVRPRLWEGVARIVRSPYLAGICLFLVCYTLLSTLLYFFQTRLVPELVPTPERRTQLFATMDLAVNALTLALQLFVTGRLLSRFGVTLMLAALPAVAIVGFVVLGFAPVLAVLIALGVLRRAGEFAISKPARETLYTVVPREEKYQAKNVIDTVVHRGGDAASAWGVAGLQVLGLTLSGMAFAGVPIACLWLATALFLGRRHEQLRGGPR
jgi:AAA family ATP:ADP antiporter